MVVKVILEKSKKCSWLDNAEVIKINFYNNFPVPIGIIMWRILYWTMRNVGFLCIFYTLRSYLYYSCKFRKKSGEISSDATMRWETRIPGFTANTSNLFNTSGPWTCLPKSVVMKHVVAQNLIQVLTDIRFELSTLLIRSCLIFPHPLTWTL